MQDLRRYAAEFRHLIALLFVVAVSFLGSCGGGEEPASLRIAITTSTRDSGLMGELVPVFEKKHDCQVILIAKGTGAALKLGANGDVDAIVVHSPAAEKKFMDAGHGDERVTFMRNYFLIAGPSSDPAEIRGRTPEEAFKRIREARSRFLSRGDDSGTHNREISLWETVGGLDKWDDYTESGRGMGATLTMADELQAYVLSDVATYARFKSKTELEALVPEGNELENPYSVIIVNPERRPEGEHALAKSFLEFMSGDQAAKIIDNYTIEGRQVFEVLRR